MTPNRDFCFCFFDLHQVWDATSWHWVFVMPALSWLKGAMHGAGQEVKNSPLL